MTNEPRKLPRTPPPQSFATKAAWLLGDDLPTVPGHIQRMVDVAEWELVVRNCPYCHKRHVYGTYGRFHRPKGGRKFAKCVYRYGQGPPGLPPEYTVILTSCNDAWGRAERRAAKLKAAKQKARAERKATRQAHAQATLCNTHTTGEPL